jgi:hypothetical protein
LLTPRSIANMLRTMELPELCKRHWYFLSPRFNDNRPCGRLQGRR